MTKIMITIDKDLLEDCVVALRYKATNEAGLSQAPDLFHAEDTLEWAQARQLEALVAHAGKAEPLGAAYRERVGVRAFQQKFGVPMAQEPAWLPQEAQEFREKFLQEELDEFVDAYDRRDMHGAADALVDLAYVLHGTALMMGLPWPMLWDEVQRKNMQKERATHAGESKRGSALDVVKPAGWVPPDHTAALGAGPWPVLEIGA